MKKEKVSVFYASDENYVPFLGVSISSLALGRDRSREYSVTVLENGIRAGSREKLVSLSEPGFEVKTVDISERIRSIAPRLPLRDYYSLAIYYRLFIPEAFPELSRAVYLDADTVVLGDVGELYDTRLYGNLAGAVPDAVIASRTCWRRYAEDYVGLDSYLLYFNSGVMLMDLEGMRRGDICGSFVSMLRRYGFETICPDQDYLNVLLSGRVRYLSPAWNRMACDTSRCPSPAILHFNNFSKPWLFDGVGYSDCFWHFCDASPFADVIRGIKENAGPEALEKAKEGERRLIATTERLNESEKSFRKMLCERNSGVFAGGRVTEVETAKRTRA
ncbi:MAG: glycosyltransferase family 8 protein [Clostridia bacterium]|nr:glycosyltransferase family 8 protein [Clostridia bacterium]